MNFELKIAILKRFPTQADFAMKVGCHESKVSQVVCGRRKLKDEEVKIWSKTIGCEPTIIQ